MRRLAALCAVLAFGVCTSRHAHAQTHDTRCLYGITPETTRLVFDALARAHDPGCAFEGVRTERASLIATFRFAGESLAPLRVDVLECMHTTPQRTGLAATVPPALAARCPSVARIVAGFESQLASAPVSGAAPSGNPSLVPIALGAQIALFALLGVMFVRLIRRRPKLSRAWVVCLVASFVFAWIVREALPNAPSNWYLEVLPPTGPPTSARFGPGAFAIPIMLRTIGLWSEPVLFATVRVFGAATVPLLALVLRECAVPWRATALACALLAVSPIHARVSASGSEHVLAQFDMLAATLAWLRATRRRDPWLAAVTLLFATLAVATRIDSAFQLLTIPLWPLFRDGSERDAGFLRARWHYTLCAFIALGVVASIAYVTIGIPARHPASPFIDLARAFRGLLTQFFVASQHQPTWFPLAGVIVTLIAIGPAIWRRPWLVARVLLVLIATFVPLGRLIERPYLVELRYFLLAITFVMVPASVGVDVMLTRFATHRTAAIALCAAVVVACAWQSRTGFTTRFTYEDEYAFLRSSLQSLPVGCTVYATPQRVAPLVFDPDCCLEVRHSPLVLAFPRLRFEPVATMPFERPGDVSCVTYYQSALCSFVDTPAVGNVRREPLRAYANACREQMHSGTMVPIAVRNVSPLATTALFGDSVARVGLYRWRP